MWQEPASGFRIRRFGDSANQTNHERYPPPAVRAAIIEPTDLPKETGSLPPSFKSLSALLAPGALLVAALVGLHVTAARPAVREFLDFYPYIVLVLGALLALRFHSSRSLFALAALALAARYSLPAAPAVTRGFVAVLLPMNLAAITCVRERGVLTPAAAVRIGTLACQAVLVSVLSRPEIAWTHWIAHPLLPWAAATLAGFMVLLRFVAVADPLTAAFLWCVPSYLVAQAANSTPMRNAVFATAGAVVLLGLVERGYRLAYHDALTGLPGRRAFDEMAAELPEIYSVALVDVDHFKKFNDLYGHETGDQVLRMVASRLARVGDGGRAFRWGGEEFVLVFPGRTVDQALDEADEIRQAIADSSFVVRSPDRRKKGPNDRGPVRMTEKEAAVTVSMGLADPARGRLTVDQVVHVADQALYFAKESGRNRIETMRSLVRHRKAAGVGKLRSAQ
ncbi:MAG TPA: GGDEF domain-containing protein [Terriglobales bacterium]|nr:GGDEF domain-containing protein [Terriglobales bacterium]